MRKSRKSRLKTAVQFDAVGPVPPTSQTAAKLRHDVLSGLLKRGRLGPVHIAAAEEIRTVHEAVGRGMFPTAQSLIRSGARSGRRQAHDFLDRMSETERFAWENHYLPWSHAMATDIAAGIPGTRWLQLVIDIVVDNATLREIEGRYRLRHGTSLSYLAHGLERYDEFC